MGCHGDNELSVTWRQAAIERAKREGSVTSEEAGLGVVPHSTPQPVGSWRRTRIAWTSALFGCTLSMSHHLPSLGRLCWTLWQSGGDCNAMAGAWAARACSRLSSPSPGPRGSRGHTCRTLPRASSVGASRDGLDRKGAHGRVNSDRAVDRSRCEADQTSGTASPHGSLACLSSQVSRRGVLLVSFSL